MDRTQYCDGCSVLEYEDAVNRYDVYSAHCCDPDKPVLGARRVVAVSGVGKPFQIQRPVWCTKGLTSRRRGKEKA